MTTTINGVELGDDELEQLARLGHAQAVELLAARAAKPKTKTTTGGTTTSEGADG